METLLVVVSPAAAFLVRQGVPVTTALVLATLAGGVYTAAVVAWLRR